MIALQVLDTQCVVQASPGSMLKMEKLRYHPKPPNQNLQFTRFLGNPFALQRLSSNDLESP